MRIRINSRICVALVIIAIAVPAAGQSNGAIKKGTVEKVSAHGAALQGNLENDSPDRDVKADNSTHVEALAARLPVPLCLQCC